jgi:hypothetical protein
MTASLGLLLLIDALNKWRRLLLLLLLMLPQSVVGHSCDSVLSSSSSLLLVLMTSSLSLLSFVMLLELNADLEAFHFFTSLAALYFERMLVRH